MRNSKELDWSYIRGERIRELTGYEGLYGVSNKGVVYNLRTRCALEPMREAYVTLSKHSKLRTYRIGDLVAREWVENKMMWEYVVHNDGNIRNNKVSNLRWSPKKESVRRGKKFKPHSVMQFDMLGGLINIYGSITDACLATGFSRSSISRCCRGLLDNVSGYRWRYENSKSSLCWEEEWGY